MMRRSTGSPSSSRRSEVLSTTSTNFEASQGADGVPPDYGYAVVDLLDGRYANAMESAGRSLESSPWFYEAWMLHGDARAALAQSRRLDPDNPLYRSVDQTIPR